LDACNPSSETPTKAADNSPHLDEIFTLTLKSHTHHHAYIPSHLAPTGDHVLDVIGMARAIDVAVVSLVCLVLDMGSRDGNAALPLFGSFINVAIILELGSTCLCQHYNTTTTTTTINNKHDKQLTEDETIQ